MPGPQQSPQPTKNRLLALLPAGERERLSARLEPVDLHFGDELVTPGEAITHAYFPFNAQISMVSLTEDGGQVEAGAVGCEGVLGVPILLGAGATPMRSVVQIPGRAARIEAAAFREEFTRPGPFQDVMFRYTHFLIVALSQSAACNRLHVVEERLSRWLLVSRDCIDSDELTLTHEFLSVMLGIRRAGVTVAANLLRADGLISYTRGRIKILDREGLQERSCECYRLVKAEYARVLG